MKTIPIRIISTQDTDLLVIRFFPTDICNYNCSYCFEGSGNVNKYRYPKDVNLVVSNFRKLFDLYAKFNKRRFHLFIAGGGEPTLWPSLEHFCKEIKEQHDVYITIVTNGSRTLRWWEENSKYFDDVVLSCHHEFVDIDHFMNVGDILFSADVKVTALMVMDATAWDKCTAYIDKMQESQYPWFIESKPVVDSPGRGTDVYTPEQSSYFGIKRIPDSEWIFKRLGELRSHESVAIFEDQTAKALKSYEVITNNWNNFKNWSCQVSFEGLSVDASGDVQGSCLLPVFNKKLNMFSSNFDLSDIQPNVITCSLESCLCQADTHISKMRV